MNNQNYRRLSWVMWIIPLSFFAYQFILRLWPGLMMQQIMDQYSIDATGFGLLAAFYYYGYSSMQIPVALLLDKFGARIILFFFTVLSGLAFALLTYTNHFYLALLSRFFVGAGSAVGFLCVSKVISEWFDRSKYSKMIGLSFSFGLLGAIYGGKPISLLLNTYEWKSIAYALSLIAITIGCCAFSILRSPSSQAKESNNTLNIKGYSLLFTSKQIWALAIINLLMVGALEGFADVWGITYLMQAYSMTKPNAALLISFIYIGMLFGGPVLTLASKYLGNYATIAVSSCILTLMLALVILQCFTLYWVIGILLFTIGILCCYQVLIFAAGAELVPFPLLGFVVAFLNSINMLGGSFFHTLIGTIMDLMWDGQTSHGGVRIYAVHAFQCALGIIPLCAAIAAILAYCTFKSTRVNKRKHFPIIREFIN